MLGTPDSGGERRIDINEAVAASQGGDDPDSWKRFDARKILGAAIPSDAVMEGNVDPNLLNFFKARGKWFRLMKEPEVYDGLESWQKRLVNKALYSTYSDMEYLGAEGQARQIILGQNPS